MDTEQITYLNLLPNNLCYAEFAYLAKLHKPKGLCWKSSENNTLLKKKCVCVCMKVLYKDTPYVLRH